MLRRSGTESGLPSCRRSDHFLLTAHLRLQSPTIVDYQIMLAAASDPEAQRWLGFRTRELVPEGRRNRLLAARPGRGGVLARFRHSCALIAVDRASGLAAGAAMLDLSTREVGGWLAPRFRGHGVGFELFAAITKLGHDHLGIASLRAGTEPANIACVAALQAAGFGPAAGPEQHRLPDGRTIPACWFQHDTDKAAYCHTRRGDHQTPTRRET